nr:MAG TPA: nucleoid-associated protein [Caudoviricetes sp.]
MKYDVTKGGYILLGRCGENLARTVEIDVSEYLNEYPGAVVTLLHRRHGESGIYPVAAELRDGCLVWQPTSADTAIVGDGEAEVRVTVDGVLAKSKILSTVVDKSLTGQETDAPEPGMDWVDKITTAIGSVQNMKAEAESVAYGEPATAEYDGKTGTIHFGIPEGRPGRDGADGKDGAAGAKGDPGSDASVTAENIEAALGYAPVKDVQVAGASVMADGVANVPMASEGALGVSSVDNYSMGITNSGNLFLYNSRPGDIDNRSANIAMAPYNLDYAVKAAMCDGKGAAWTSAEQKAARDRMGVDKAYELIETITTDGTTVIQRAAEPNGTPYNFSRAIVVVTSPKNMESSSYVYVFMAAGDVNQSSYAVFGENIAYFKRAMYSADVTNGILSYRSTDAMTVYGDIQGQGSTDAGNITQSPTLTFTVNNIKSIQVYNINFSAVPSGFLIQIYGVRA